MPTEPLTRRCELCGDVVELAAGRSIELRHLCPGDGPSLAEFYQRLGREDIHKRFFTSTLPADKWFDDWAEVSDRGGFGLVAVLRDGQETSVIAEAGYALLCDGDGELGIAVDPDARGWLGPWMLDALLQHAHERGVPNLQAVVLSTNRRMARMAASRGTATMASDDWSTSRVSMSTSGRVPSWPGDVTGDARHERPRLLVESDRSRWGGAAEAIKAGFDVMVCSGLHGKKHGCVLLEGKPCPLRDGADVIAELLDPANPANVELLLSDAVVHSGIRTIPGFRDDPLTGAPARRPDAEILQELRATTTHDGDQRPEA